MFCQFHSVMALDIRIPDYSGGHAATVSSVLVTNLSTGVKKGEWDKVEVLFDKNELLVA